MNTIRMIAITLPMTLLLACGGGGGGTAAAPATTPPTNMPGTDDPMTPPPVTLPGYVITDLAAARTAVGGAEPTSSMTETEIVTAIQTRATAFDYFEFSDFDAMEDADTVSVDGDVDDDSYSAMVPDVGALTFSLTGIADLSLVDDTGLMDFDSDTELVMEDEGVTIIQSQAAAGQDDGTRLSFQSYGGWLDNSVFGVVSFDVLESDETTSRFASFSFGDASGSRPTGSGLVWGGVMVGMTETGEVIQSDLSVQYTPSSDPNIITEISFNRLKNLNTGNDFRVGIVNRLQFLDVPIEMDGSFESASGDIKGNFYGDNHAQIGGVFNRSNLVGAFGGVKQ